jgi:hypothetical protein
MVSMLEPILMSDTDKSDAGLESKFRSLAVGAGGLWTQC